MAVVTPDHTANPVFTFSFCLIKGRVRTHKKLRPVLAGTVGRNSGGKTAFEHFIHLNKKPGKKFFRADKIRMRQENTKLVSSVSGHTIGRADTALCEAGKILEKLIPARMTI